MPERRANSAGGTNRSPLALVRPELLRWARETAGMTLEAAARRIGVKPSKLADWEEERARPTVVQLRKMAHVYKRALAVFFLTSPPQEPALLHDFRRLRPNEPLPLSPALRLEMRRARRRRAVALELLAEEGGSAAALPRASVEDDPDRVAASGRAWLGVTFGEQTRWRGDYEGLAGWSALFEARNILVFHSGDVPLSEMRGFSLSEPDLPVIVLNAKDTPRGRLFTLMHEFVHLMLNRGGVCDPLGTGRRATTPDEQVEVFCNRVSGAILVLERTTEDFYEAKRREYLEQYRLAAARRQEMEGYAPLYRLVVRDNGRRYTKLVLDAFTRELITGADVSDYLGVRLKHLGDIADAVQERAAQA